MQIQILSDLHLETPPSSYTLFTFAQTAPNLALLGDIGNTLDDAYFAFLAAQLARYQRVFLVLGNHEPYRSSLAASKSRLTRFAREWNKHARSEPPPPAPSTSPPPPSTSPPPPSTSSCAHASRGELILLDQTRVDVDDTLTVLGATLFSRVLAAQKRRVSSRLNDFARIAGWTVAAHEQAHAADLAWLNAQVAAIAAREPARRVVVFTHYSPTLDPRASDPVHAASGVASAFASDLRGEACWGGGAGGGGGGGGGGGVVRLWAFGHTHFNCEFVEEASGVRLVTNQRGYWFAPADGFRPERVFTL